MRASKVARALCACAAQNERKDGVRTAVESEGERDPSRVTGEVNSLLMKPRKVTTSPAVSAATAVADLRSCEGETENAASIARM